MKNQNIAEKYYGKRISRADFSVYGHIKLDFDDSTSIKIANKDPGNNLEFVGNGKDLKGMIDEKLDRIEIEEWVERGFHKSQITVFTKNRFFTVHFLDKQKDSEILSHIEITEL